MEFKIDRKEVFAILIVFFLSLGFWLVPVKSTLPDFGAATQIRASIAGQPEPAYIEVAAFIAKAAGSYSSPQAIAAFLLVFPGVILALSSILLYGAVRRLDIKRTPAAFAALLFPLSLAAFSFLPGVYSSTSLAALFFALFLFHLCGFAAKKKQLMLVPAIVLGAIAAYFNATFGIAGIAAVVSLGATGWLKGDKRIAQFAIIAIALAAGMFLSADNTGLFFNPQNGLNAFVLSPFIVAAASISAVLFFVSSASVDHFLLFLSGLLVAAFSAPAGAMLLVIPAAGGMSAAIEENRPKLSKLASAFFLAFFVFSGLALAAGSSALQAFAISALLSTLAPLALHFYEYRSHRLMPAFALALVALSASFSLFVQLPPQHGAYPAYSDKDLASALSYLSQNNAAGIAMLGSADEARFYLPSVALSGEQDFTSYLLTGSPRPASGAYLVISTSYLDDPTVLGSPGFEALAYSNNFTSSSSYYALFYSQAGTLVAREISTDGTLALKDGILLDQSGQSYGYVPLSHMIMLRPDKPFSDPANRMLSLDEGSSPPYLLKIYAGQASELDKVQEFGKVSIYKVK